MPTAGLTVDGWGAEVEIIASILDFLPVRDQLAFARVSHRLREMVYDDSRWVVRLQRMGVWNEAEARQRFDEAMRRRRASEERRFAEARKKPGAGAGAEAATAIRASTLFDSAEEAARDTARRNMLIGQRVSRMTISPAGAGTGVGSGSAPGSGGAAGAAGAVGAVRSGGGGRSGSGVRGGSGGAGAGAGGLRPPLTDRASLLTVMRSVRSIRGLARLEYARVHAALAPLYGDLVRARTHTDPAVFQMFSDPEEQAQMLAQLRAFAASDAAPGWRERTGRLEAMAEVFENAALREFEGGYEGGDVDGRMRRYAHVLITLNGGLACVQLFVQKHPVLYEKEELGNPIDCFEWVSRCFLFSVLAVSFLFSVFFSSVFCSCRFLVFSFLFLSFSLLYFLLLSFPLLRFLLLFSLLLRFLFLPFSLLICSVLPPLFFFPLSSFPPSSILLFSSSLPSLFRECANKTAGGW